jgi:hypothetical protein
VLGASLARLLEYALEHDGALEETPARDVLDFVAEYKKRPRPPPPPPRKPRDRTGSSK